MNDNKKNAIINFRNKDKDLSTYACSNQNAFRLKPEDEDFRTPFFRDSDRIIYSLSYTRYIDKTQVFSLNDNDNISKRIVHVAFVSKIARTIGRALNLNEDLIEAGALGHDLGHVPFGHEGERILNEISLKYDEGYFNHNVQSARTMMFVENNGKGCNLNFQTLDAILCHNGEFIQSEYYPKAKTKEEFLKEYEDTYKDKDAVNALWPMTLEGCVVRISDLIGYIGRDLEDAIYLHLIKISDIPQSIIEVLGSTNREIINTIVSDIIENSMNKPYIKLSAHIYNAIMDLKNFNTEHIYLKANSKEERELYKKMFNRLFEVYIKHLENNDTTSDIYKIFLDDKNEKYLNNTTNARKVIDYIAGMTDDFFVNQFSKYK